MDTDTIYTLHLFAGAGGGILGDLLLGHIPVGAVEIEAYPRKVLLARQLDGSIPRFPIWDDVCTFRADNHDTSSYIERLRRIRDRLCICGGFPCQDISSAGGPNRKGLDGKKSGLWFEMLRIICEIRPAFIFVENSPMLVVRGFSTVLGDLAEMGYDARWGVFSAGDVGARHERERMWISAIDRNSDKITEISKRRIHEPSKKSFRVMSKGISSIPEMGRKIDGVAGWMDRLAAIGNGQVPQVVKLAWETLS